MSTPKIEAPAPVNAAETAKQSIQAQLDAMPKILAAQQQYGSQFAGLDVANLQQYIPALGDLSRSEQTKNVALTNQLYPSTSLAENKLGDYLGGQDFAGQQGQVTGDLNSALEDYLSGSDPLTANQTRNITESYRSGSLARGQTQFGFDAINEATSIENLRENMRQQRLNARLQKANVQNQLNLQGINTALSTAGRVPVSAGAQIGFNNPGTLVQQQDPNAFYNSATTNNANQLAVSQYNASAVNPLGQFAGSLLGNIGGGLATGWAFNKFGGK